MKIHVNTMKLLKECQDRKDVRDWMGCVHIYHEGYAATTNGHLAFLSEKLEGKPISKDLVIRINWMSFSGVEYYGVDEKRQQLVGMNKDNQPVQFIPYVETDYQIMNIKQIVSRHEPSTNGMGCFDPAYLKVMSNFKKGSQTLFKMGKDGTPSLLINEAGTYVLMPQTYADKDLPELVRI